MGDMLNLEGRWPELFEGLTPTTINAIRQAFAANWHEGWEPNYEDVKRLTDYKRGLITHEEYIQDARQAARRETSA